MESTAIQKKPGARTGAAPKQPRRISWQEFQNRYMERENGYKYEWVNGIVEKTKCTMNPNQLFIQRNLTSFFWQLLNDGKVHGGLLAEPDLLLFDEHHRRPDMAWLTNEQIDNLAVEGVIEVPAFVIEVISNNDAAAKLVDKMEDYRKAGVQVVWQIYPKIRQIQVYSGKNLRHSTVLIGDEICSAAPVLPAFELAVNEVFKTSTVL
ncbi:MAG: Uma2 family endonuclease [Saprospiraceae bacterium]|nr:MAG: Uma2 family endonuclease [Saprospiraceae bacterium]